MFLAKPDFGLLFFIFFVSRARNRDGRKNESKANNTVETKGLLRTNGNRKKAARFVRACPASSYGSGPAVYFNLDDVPFYFSRGLTNDERSHYSRTFFILARAPRNRTTKNYRRVKK